MAAISRSSRPRVVAPADLPVSALVDHLRERGFRVLAVGARLDVSSRRRKHSSRTQAARLALLGREAEALACLAAEAEARRIEDSLGDLTRYSLAFSEVRLAEVEHARFPSLVGIYWALAASGELPTQGEFVGEVARALGRDGDEAVRARAARAYPSLVRQQHFEALLRRRFPGVHHSEALDHLGIDIVVREGAIVVGLRLAFDSPAAREWRERKDQRRPVPTGLPCLDLLARAGELGVGEFWLHHRRQVAEVERFVEETRARLDADPEAALLSSTAGRLMLGYVFDSDREGR